jgi:hypothetical protein
MELDIAEAMNKCAAPLPCGESGLKFAEITASPGTVVEAAAIKANANEVEPFGHDQNDDIPESEHWHQFAKACRTQRSEFQPSTEIRYDAGGLICSASSSAGYVQISASVGW